MFKAGGCWRNKPSYIFREKYQDSVLYLLTAPPHLPAEPLHLLQLHDSTEHRTNLNKQPSFGCLASNVPLRLPVNETSLSALFRFSCSAASNQCSLFDSPLSGRLSLPTLTSLSGFLPTHFPLYVYLFYYKGCILPRSTSAHLFCPLPVVSVSDALWTFLVFP